MVIECIGAIILSVILAMVSFHIFIYVNSLFAIPDEEVGETIALSTKCKVAALDLVSLFAAHLVIKAIGVKGFIYRLLPSRCDNMYIESILFVLLVIPLMLVISRFIIKKCANAAVLNATEFKYLVPVLAIIPTVITGLILTFGLGYALVIYALPLYLLGYVAAFFVLRLFF